MNLEWESMVGGLKYIKQMNLVYRFARSFFPSKPLPMWKERLNHFFENDVRIYTSTENTPIIHNEGKYTLPKEQAERAAEIAKNLRENELQSILTQIPDWNSKTIQFRVRTIKYADLLALREIQLPNVLSANVLLICRKNREIILQRRGSQPYVKTYWDCLGTFGGGYDPREHKDADSLLLTAIREVWEEARLPWAPPHPHLIIAEELTTGYIQIAYLGVNISTEARELIRPRIVEGTPVYFSYDELAENLKLPVEKSHNFRLDGNSGQGWVPTSKAHILAWLAHGAPGAGRKAKFAGLTAHQLFNSLVPKLS